MMNRGECDGVSAYVCVAVVCACLITRLLAHVQALIIIITSLFFIIFLTFSTFNIDLSDL